MDNLDMNIRIDMEDDNELSEIAYLATTNCLEHLGYETMYKIYRDFVNADAAKYDWTYDDAKDATPDDKIATIVQQYFHNTMIDAIKEWNTYETIDHNTLKGERHERN